MGDPTEVRDLLDERPDLEPALEAVLEPAEPWSFDDVDVDSGPFGELVSQGIVESDGDEYRVADRDAVEAALAGDDRTETVEDGPGRSAALRAALPTVSRLELLALAGVIGFVVVARLVSLPAVYRGGHVVLSGNDAYFFRYFVDGGTVGGGYAPGDLPPKVTASEPLFVWLATAVSTVLGGTTATVGHVMAWYPVVTAALTAGLLYGLTVIVTGDKRVGLAAVALLALSPGHAFRTSLGFADHHAFDYLWLALTGVAVTAVVRATHDGRPWRSPTVSLGALGVGIGIAGQLLAWEGGALLVVPLAVYLGVEHLLAVHADRPLARTTVPLLAGIALASGLVGVTHTAWGWQPTLVAATPVLLLLGGVGVTVLGEAWRRTELPTVGLVAGELLVAVGGLLAFTRVTPDAYREVRREVSNGLLLSANIAETGGLLGQSFGWLLLFGFVLVLAVPYLLVGTRAMVDSPRWRPVVAYTWILLLLGLAQIRFVGSLSVFVALFAGVGFVAVADWVDITERPLAVFDDSVTTVRSLAPPSRQTLGSLFVLLLLVGSLSFVQIPVKTSQVTYSEEQFDTATWMANHSEAEGSSYPQNYVFSQWGDNRFYNYFANGQSRQYFYAQKSYGDFVTSRSGPGWYENLRERPVGYIVTSPRVVSEPDRIGTRLYRYNGSRTDDLDALAHYRLVYVSPDETYKVFEPVPGATLSGQTTPNGTVTVRTNVTVPGGEFTYVRTVTADSSGNYTVVVPYPGRYDVAGVSVTVPESAVEASGSYVGVPSTPGNGTDESTG